MWIEAYLFGKYLPCIRPYNRNESYLPFLYKGHHFGKGRHYNVRFLLIQKL